MSHIVEIRTEVRDSQTIAALAVRADQLHTAGFEASRSLPPLAWSLSQS